MIFSSHGVDGEFDVLLMINAPAIEAVTLLYDANLIESQLLVNKDDDDAILDEKLCVRKKRHGRFLM